MSLPQDLRVIGSRSIFRFFLPPEGGPFVRTEFTLVEPVHAEEAFTKIVPDSTLTILVNPDDYELAQINLLQGKTCLWFLRRLAVGRPESYHDAPRLLMRASEEIGKRAGFFSQLNLHGGVTVVVSDAASYQLCLSRGIDAKLSPPPVNERLADLKGSVPRISLALWAGQSEYSSQFGSFPTESRIRHMNSESVLDSDFGDVSHSIIIQESVIREFPYEVALCLTAGHTVIAQALEPRWGLEPGIDFMEVSTPEELFYTVEALWRSPSSSNLMSKRGKGKASTFRSSAVLEKVLHSIESEKRNL